MSYTKHNFVSGDTLLASDLNAMEDQIAANEQTGSDLKSAKAPVIIDTASGAIASFEDGANGMPIKALTVNIEPVQSGTGDPSPTNVRPISGWTGCNVSRTGKNLIPNGTDSSNGYLNNYFLLLTGKTGADADYYVSEYFPVIAGEKYTYSTDLSNPSTESICFYDDNKEYLIGYRLYHVQNITITVPDNAVYARATQIKDGHYFQLERGTVATGYEPFGNIYHVAFPSPDPGTVYGGTLDVANGVLTVTHGRKNLKDLSYVRNTVDTHTINGSGVTDRIRGNNITNFLSTEYTVATSTTIANIDYGIAFANSNVTTIYVRNKDLTQDEFIAAMANSDAYIVYPLASPIEIPLSDIQEVTTLLGENNIWADCGPVSVDYPADTKLYIQKINAPTEDDMIANNRIESGKYFLVGNTLYLSTTLILAGETIIPGTNCTKTNLAEALNALNT